MIVELVRMLIIAILLIIVSILNIKDQYRLKKIYQISTRNILCIIAAINFIKIFQCSRIHHIYLKIIVQFNIIILFSIPLQKRVQIILESKNTRNIHILLQLTWLQVQDIKINSTIVNK